MCLISFAWRQHEEYPLAFSANRDEFLERATSPMHFWQPENEILAGKDLVAGGTWMGFHTNGRFAALTNVRDPAYFKPGQFSRGALIIDFLNSPLSPANWSDELALTHAKYHGFNLIYGDQEQLFYFGSQAGKAMVLNPGVYGLCNAELNTPWPKVELAKRQMTNWLKKPDETSIARLHSSTDKYNDTLLPNTGIPIDFERSLSAQKIVLPNYGTRAQTGFVITRQGELRVTEYNLDETTTKNQFTIADFWNAAAPGATV